MEAKINPNGPGLGPQYADLLGISEQLKKNTVVTAFGNFEEHPEAYRPRIFCRTEHGSGKTYELLQDGQAVVWPKAPDADKVKFTFWLIDIESLKDMNIKRPQTPTGEQPLA